MATYLRGTPFSTTPKYAIGFEVRRASSPDPQTVVASGFYGDMPNVRFYEGPHFIAAFDDVTSVSLAYPLKTPEELWSMIHELDSRIEEVKAGFRISRTAVKYLCGSGSFFTRGLRSKILGIIAYDQAK